MSEKDLIKDALERFAAAADAESDQRKRFAEDMKFAAGQQWPEDIKTIRESDPYGARPCLTMDKTAQYRRQVINDARQNSPSIKVRPADDGADEEVAEILQGLVRHIEDASNAEIAYDRALDDAVTAGLGWFRITTQMIDEGKNWQEARIQRIPNLFSVYQDCDAVEPDGSDQQWNFVVDDMPRKRFERLYPKFSPESWPSDGQGWITSDTIRVSEYFHIEETTENLLLLPDDELILEADYWAMFEGFADRPQVVGNRTRRSKQCKWAKMTAKEVIEETIFPSQWIPLIPVLGNEAWIDGKRTLTGMIRWVMDAQRAYNYARSSYVENVALAPKAPFVAAAGQVEDFADEWSTANTRNHAVLRYNPTDINGTPVPPPQRQMPPPISSGWMQDMQISERDIQSALGMYSASIGAEGQEKSGRAILARQREGDTSTFHYIDNLSRSIRHAGRILVDMIPHIYDTRRVTRIVGQDGKTETATLDPNLPKALAKIQHENEEVRRIYNPNVGTYDVAITVGPSYTTKRQEAADAMVELTRANPQMMPIVGDLMVRAMDWPMADEIADRLKAMLPPQIAQLEEKDDEEGGAIQAAVQAVTQQYEAQAGQAMQAIQSLQAQLQQAQEALNQAAQDQAIKAAELQIKDREVGVKEYEAQTERIQVASSVQSSPANDNDDAAEMAQFAALQTMLNQLAQKVDAMCALPPAAPVINVTVEKGGTVRKEMAIQAPSGEMYQGIVTEEEC